MYQRILVPVDGSPASQRGLDEAIALARLTQGQIRLLHVVDETSFAFSAGASLGGPVDILPLLREGGQAVLLAARERVVAAGVAADTVLQESLMGRLTDFVLREIEGWGAEVVVIGSHGRRGARRLLLGSDAEEILRRATVPVLVVREQSGEA